MGRIYNDTERLLEIAQLSNNGHHGQAARDYQDMANEVRNPAEKKQLWDLAEKSRKKGE